MSAVPNTLSAILLIIGLALSTEEETITYSSLFTTSASSRSSGACSGCDLDNSKIRFGTTYHNTTLRHSLTPIFRIAGIRHSSFDLASTAAGLHYVTDATWMDTSPLPSIHNKDANYLEMQLTSFISSATHVKIHDETKEKEKMSFITQWNKCFDHLRLHVNDLLGKALTWFRPKRDPAVADNLLESSSKDNKEDEDDDDDEPIKRSIVNYAHKSAGALILETSPASMKGASNLLVSDNDKYAIAPCSEEKHVVIGLSEDILVKTVTLSNHERYSSSVQEFKILGSQSFPVRSKEDWHDLGVYRADLNKIHGGTQEFELHETSWARYLKFQFRTHYGVEDYCTITQIKVHGSTMLQGFHEQWEESEKKLNHVVLSMSIVSDEVKHDESPDMLQSDAAPIGKGQHSENASIKSLPAATLTSSVESKNSQIQHAQSQKEPSASTSSQSRPKTTTKPSKTTRMEPILNILTNEIQSLKTQVSDLDASLETNKLEEIPPLKNQIAIDNESRMKKADETLSAMKEEMIMIRWEWMMHQARKQEEMMFATASREKHTRLKDCYSLASLFMFVVSAMIARFKVKPSCVRWQEANMKTCDKLDNQQGK